MNTEFPWPRQSHAEYSQRVNVVLGDARSRCGTVGYLGTGEQPAVSVVVPTFRRPKLLGRAITSILGQSFADFEIVIVNDGVCDIEGDLQDALADPRVSLVRHGRNRGLAAARNTGLRQSRGKLIAYLDDDDYFAPDHLERLVFGVNWNVTPVAYSDAARVLEEEQNGAWVPVTRERPFSIDFDVTHVLIANFVPVCCLVHRRDCLVTTGLFDEQLPNLEDWDLLTRLGMRFNVAHLAHISSTFTIRAAPDSMTTAPAQSVETSYYATTLRLYQRYESIAALFPQVLKAQDKSRAGAERAMLAECGANDDGSALPLGAQRNHKGEDAQAELAEWLSTVAHTAPENDVAQWIASLWDRGFHRLALSATKEVLGHRALPEVEMLSARMLWELGHLTASLTLVDELAARVPHIIDPVFYARALKINLNNQKALAVVERALGDNNDFLPIEAAERRILVDLAAELRNDSQKP